MQNTSPEPQPESPSGGPGPSGPWWAVGPTRLLLIAAGLVLVLGASTGVWAWNEREREQARVAEQRAEAEREGVLTLESQPSGAEVFEEGRLLGQTPLALSVRGLAEERRVVLRAPTYLEHAETLVVRPGERRSHRVELRAVPGSLTITSQPDGARLRLGSDREGQTPLVVRDLPPGRYELEVSLPEHQPFKEALVVGAGEHVIRTVTLKLMPARVQVVGSELTGASVLLDGKAAGVVPATLSDLAPGIHEVRVEHEGRTHWEGKFELKPGEERRIDVAPLPPLADHPDVEAQVKGEKPFPVAVIIENSADARPQSGLHSAAVVYEALAEGGISRFMAVYANGLSKAIGPVRSARDYFVTLAKEFNAPLVHIGSSPQGYEAIHSLGVKTLDETRGMPGFWRSTARVAPHNAYVSTDSVKQALAGVAGKEPGAFAGFTFKRSPAAQTAAQSSAREARTLAINYGWGYRVGYEYDPATNSYGRFMDRAPHVDAESGEQLKAANVIVMTVQSAVIDGEGRLELDQVGEGRARVFLDGKVIEGRWRKSSLTSSTRFVDADGEPVPLNPGQTWVQIVPQTATLNY